MEEQLLIILHTAPILEIGRILAARGHQIEFGTLRGREHWAEKHDFVSRIHTLGPSASAEEEEKQYFNVTKWDINGDLSAVLECKKFLDKSWPDVYRGLQTLIADPTTRPDFILADYLVDAARDMQVEHDIPLAMHCPQMPTLMIPTPYIPGHAGFQVEVLSSEYASIWQRIKCELVFIKALPTFISYLMWVRKRRREAGVKRMLKWSRKPDYLCLVNSCFGVEIPKDLPPMVAAIGPVLADEYPPLTEALRDFLHNRERVLYIGLGSHVILPNDRLQTLISGVMAALNRGHVDVVIWSIRETARKQLNKGYMLYDRQGRCFTAGCILDGKQENWMVSHWVPQRAILDHPNTRIFLTHGGASSTNEIIFHGIPAITLGIYFDQLTHAIRLQLAGVSETLDKNSFTEFELPLMIERIMADADGSIQRNVQRMKYIGRIASQRKYLAADLIEEVLFDHEGRDIGGKKARPMHLQTADMRMPFWKARNWDMYALLIAVIMLLLGVVIALPIILSQRL